MSEEETKEEVEEEIEDISIISPYIAAPMVLVYSEGKTYLGGFLGFNQADLLQIDHPLCYVEEFTPQGMQAGVKPVYMSVGPIEMINVNAGCVYMLDNRNKSDRALVGSYKSAVDKMLAAEKGIVLASDSDVAKVNKVKLS